MYNAGFMSGLGPQVAGAQPPPVDPARAQFEWAQQQDAQEEAIRMGIHQMLAAQAAGTRQSQMGLAATGAGMVAKDAVPQVGQAISSAANYVMAPAKAAVDAGKSAYQTYVSGGKVTTSAAPEAANEGFSLSSLSGPASAAYAAYNAYQGVNSGLRNSKMLREAYRSADLTPEEEMRLRDQSFKQGMEDSRMGAFRGSLSGLTVGGPIGAVVGGTLGGTGGMVQAMQAYRGAPGNDRKELAEAVGKDRLNQLSKPPVNVFDLAKSAKHGKVAGIKLPF